MGDGGRALLTVLVVLSLPLAGCIGMGEDTSDEPLEQDDVQRESQPSDQMTAQERVDDEQGADANVPPFYSRTTYTLTGQVLLDRLPVLLSTVNGEVTIELSDGTTSYSDDGDEATFRTTSYEDRDIRTQVSLDTTNGDITVTSL